MRTFFLACLMALTLSGTAVAAEWRNPDAKRQQPQSGSGEQHILLQNRVTEATVPLIVAQVVDTRLMAHGLPQVQYWVENDRPINQIMRLITYAQICKMAREAYPGVDAREAQLHREACALTEAVSVELTGKPFMGREVAKIIPHPTREQALRAYYHQWPKIQRSLNNMRAKEEGR